jgi:AraC family transcriptional regulator of adaptative response/methylated-DNA-[protein]-cysteine methyltransferase
LVASTSSGVCAIGLGDEQAGLVAALQQRFPKAQLCGPADGHGESGAESLALQTALAEVIRSIDTGTALEVALDIRGTPFQQQVWQALQAIPPGHTASYGDIARRLGQPKAVRAVAQACAANLLAVVIPCHRVVRSDGQLSGYRWGVARKAALLAREAAQA